MNIVEKRKDWEFRQIIPIKILKILQCFFDSTQFFFINHFMTFKKNFSLKVKKN